MRTRVYRADERVTVTDATPMRARKSRSRKPVAFTMRDATVALSRDGTVQLILPKPPSANRYWRVYRGRAVKSAEARSYQLAVASIVATSHQIGFRVARMTGDVSVSLTWWRRDQTGDLDNLLKCALDSLKGVVYADDKQVTTIHAERHDGPYDGRVVIEVRSVVRDALRVAP